METSLLSESLEERETALCFVDINQKVNAIVATKQLLIIRKHQ